MYKNKQVIVKTAPISERYWFDGCVGTVYKDQIRVGGAWFVFDERWEVEDVK